MGGRHLFRVVGKRTAMVKARERSMIAAGTLRIREGGADRAPLQG